LSENKTKPTVNNNSIASGAVEQLSAVRTDITAGSAVLVPVFADTVIAVLERNARDVFPVTATTVFARTLFTDSRIYIAS